MKQRAPGPPPLPRRLHAEMQRQRASPALRLLDQLLDVLDPGEDLLTAQGSEEAALDAAAGLAGPGGDAEEGSGDEEEERERALATQQREDEAVALMVAAFSGGEASGAGDVFQLAAMLAEGERRPEACCTCWHAALR